jgi:cytochrome c oxidase subunit 4
MNDPAAVTFEEPHVHIVPLRLLMGVGAALLVLTAVTVGATYVDLGRLNLAVALLIAVVKATLVALYFMHLRWDRPLNAIVFVAAIGFVILFVLLAVMDTLEYAPLRIPDHAPAINR